SFTFKVTFRNLLRYKSRFFMSVLGIAGCTSLLVAGFGLQHSISSIVDLQFGGILTYDAAVAFDTDSDSETLDGLTELIGESDTVNSYMGAYQAIKEVSSDSRSVSDCYIVAPEDINEIGKYIDLRERKSGLKLYIPEDGAIINEKLANILSVKVGDTITAEDGSRALTVLGITENYANNYVYITQKTCGELFGESASNSYLIDLADGFDSSAFSERILKNDAVLSVTFTVDGGDRFRDLIESLTLVVILIIVFSGALAFVILFNLVTINVNERIHELATLKVLGFFDGEVSSYIFRENIFSTLIGMLVGLAGGVGLLKIVIIFAEADSVMFNPTIPAYCFAVAAAITILFSALVNITMHFRMKKIDMATSLKAVE
ncbi:MAG: ABC transporter permease, partial [Oscillospiraceae bacterium]